MNVVKIIICVAVCALAFRPFPSGMTQKLTYTAEKPTYQIPLKDKTADSLQESIRMDKIKINNLIKILKHMRRQESRPIHYTVFTLPPVKYDLNLKPVTDTLEVDIQIPYKEKRKRNIFNFLKRKK